MVDPGAQAPGPLSVGAHLRQRPRREVIHTNTQPTPSQRSVSAQLCQLAPRVCVRFRLSVSDPKLLTCQKTSRGKAHREPRVSPKVLTSQQKSPLHRELSLVLGYRKVCPILGVFLPYTPPIWGASECSTYFEDMLSMHRCPHM